MRFTNNWNNKLNCSYFTTIRKYTSQKFKYYESKLNKVDAIYIKNVIFCRAKLVRIDICKLSEINIMLKIIDTGTSEYLKVFDWFGLKDDDKVMLLLYNG